MKKRKPPIIAVTILCICAAIAFGFNYKAGIDPNAPPPTNTPPAEVQVSPPRPTQGVSKTVNDVKGQMGATGMPQAPPSMAKRNPMMMKGPSSIANIKMGSMKPQPNDSAVSSQWYQPQSSRSGQ